MMQQGTKRPVDDYHHHDNVLATLYRRFDNLAVYLQGKNIVPYRPNLRQCKVANMEVANTVSPQPLTLNTIEDIDSFDEHIDPFYSDISFIFSREQLAPLLIQRTTEALWNFEGLAASTEDFLVLSDSLRNLCVIDGTLETALIEVPRHTCESFLIHRRSFDRPYETFLYVFNKSEFFNFKNLVEQIDTVKHEKGPIGIGKTILCYTYGN